MSSATRAEPSVDLCSRLAALGRRLGEREAAFAPALREAERRAQDLHRRVSDALEAFQIQYAQSGAMSFDVTLSAPRLDDKHVRSVELELRRGRHVAIIVVSGRGDVTLVGPFHAGKNEGPCQRVPWDDRPELEAAIAGLLERYLEQAATP